MTIRGYYHIMRPVNAVMAGLAVALAYLLATGTLLPPVILGFIIVFLITGAGNTINDYFDLPIDRINRPERPIPSGMVTQQGALLFAGLLFLSGIGLSLFTNPIGIFFAVFNSLLLVAYAAKLKTTPLAGNVMIAYLSGSIFLFGGGLAGLSGLFNNLVIASITFFAMMAREIMKDAEDIPGDKAKGAKTFPILYGVRTATLMAVVSALVAVLVSLYPYRRWGIWYLAGIIPVDMVILYASYQAFRCRDPDCIKKSRATSLIKYGMFASLIVFTIAAVFLTG